VAAPTVRVWDRFVRVFHWTLVLCFFSAWWFTESIGWVHKGCGYVALALVAARVVWGFVGSGHARFASFVPTPRALMAYVYALLRGREPHSLGHNPAGAVMILFLLCAVSAIGISGWMLTLDAFWGSDIVEQTHTLLVDATLVAVALHVAANIYESIRQRDNLIGAMVTGRKRAVLPKPVWFDDNDDATAGQAWHSGRDTLR
jgi:cytochrome b